MDLTHSSIGYSSKEGNAEHAGYSNAYSAIRRPPYPASTREA